MFESYSPYFESPEAPIDIVSGVFAAVQLGQRGNIRREARKPDTVAPQPGLRPPHRPVDVVEIAERRAVPTRELLQQLDQIIANSIATQAARR